MFAITINQGGLIGGMIDKEELGLPEGTAHYVINETEFESIQQLAEHIMQLSNQQSDNDIVWRFRVGTHNVDVEQLKLLLSYQGIKLTVREEEQLRGSATEI